MMESQGLSASHPPESLILGYSIPMQEIYLDYNATTPCDPAVVEAMLPFFSTDFGNPASRQHEAGRHAFQALENARKQIAAILGARSATEILFSSGATEANNFLLKGLAWKLREGGLHIITQATEHPAVLGPLASLREQGFEVDILGVAQDGQLDIEEFRRALRPDTILASIMAANNETGVLQPIDRIAELTREAGVHLHCDAAQAIGKIPVNLRSLGVDSMAISAHKFYGPKGVGALYLRRNSTRPLPLLEGGGQEYGLRSGTSNVAGAVGMSRALQLVSEKLGAESLRIKDLRDRFEEKMLSLNPRSRINGAEAPRLPNTSNISFPGSDGQALTASLRGLALSTGSACSSATQEASHVLAAMGIPRATASSTLRISLGRYSHREEVLAAARTISTELQGLRARKGRRR